jgi:hypothetical protein
MILELGGLYKCKNGNIAHVFDSDDSEAMGVIFFGAVEVFGIWTITGQCLVPPECPELDIVGLVEDGT